MRQLTICSKKDERHFMGGLEQHLHRIKDYKLPESMTIGRAEAILCYLQWSLSLLLEEAWNIAALKTPRQLDGCSIQSGTDLGGHQTWDCLLCILDVGAWWGSHIQQHDVDLLHRSSTLNSSTSVIRRQYMPCMRPSLNVDPDTLLRAMLPSQVLKSKIRGSKISTGWIL